MMMLRISFSFAMGPLLFGIPCYRNSLVFHSLDRLTSLKIHLGPALAMFMARWYDDSIATSLNLEAE